jgi:hypothetical protein
VSPGAERELRRIAGALEDIRDLLRPIAAAAERGARPPRIAGRCRTCQGSGYTPPGVERCAACGGTGLAVAS